jgi:hypothetical protein
MVGRAATDGADISGGMANGAVVVGEMVTEVLAAGVLFEGVVIDGGVNDGLSIGGALTGGALIAEACGVNDRKGVDCRALGCGGLNCGGLAREVLVGGLCRTCLWLSAGSITAGCLPVGRWQLVEPSETRWSKHPQNGFPNLPTTDQQLSSHPHLSLRFDLSLSLRHG